MKTPLFLACAILAGLTVAALQSADKPAEPPRKRPHITAKAFYNETMDACLLLTHLRDGPPFANECIIGQEILQDVVELVRIDSINKDPKQHSYTVLNKDGKRLSVWLQFRQIEGGSYIVIQKQ